METGDLPRVRFLFLERRRRDSHPSIAILQTAALLLGYAAARTLYAVRITPEFGVLRGACSVMRHRAGDGIRTRDPYLGKVVLYQLSYSRENPGPNGSRTRVFTLKE